jgi:hypothetical protein
VCLRGEEKSSAAAEHHPPGTPAPSAQKEPHEAREAPQSRVAVFSEPNSDPAPADPVVAAVAAAFASTLAAIAPEF